MSFDEYYESYVTCDTVRHHLGDISRMTIWRYVQDGMPVHVTRTGRQLFRLSEVDAWLFAEQEVDRFKRTTSTTGEDVA